MTHVCMFSFASNTDMSFDCLQTPRCQLEFGIRTLLNVNKIYELLCEKWYDFLFEKPSIKMEAYILPIHMFQKIYDTYET